MLIQFKLIQKAKIIYKTSLYVNNCNLLCFCIPQTTLPHIALSSIPTPILQYSHHNPTRIRISDSSNTNNRQYSSPAHCNCCSLCCAATRHPAYSQKSLSTLVRSSPGNSFLYAPSCCSLY